MGYIYKLRGRSGEMKKKVADLAQQHGEKIDQGLSKAGGAASRATKGKYDDKIDTVAQKARQGVQKLREDKPDGGTAGRP